jgi:hypothetical protein
MAGFLRLENGGSHLRRRADKRNVSPCVARKTPCFQWLATCVQKFLGFFVISLLHLENGWAI